MARSNKSRFIVVGILVFGKGKYKRTILQFYLKSGKRAPFLLSLGNSNRLFVDAAQGCETSTGLHERDLGDATEIASPSRRSEKTVGCRSKSFIRRNVFLNKCEASVCPFIRNFTK